MVWLLFFWTPPLSPLFAFSPSLVFSLGAAVDLASQCSPHAKNGTAVLKKKISQSSGCLPLLRKIIPHPFFIFSLWCICGSSSFRFNKVGMYSSLQSRGESPVNIDKQLRMWLPKQHPESFSKIPPIPSKQQPPNTLLFFLSEFVLFQPFFFHAAVKRFFLESHAKQIKNKRKIKIQIKEN